MILTHPSYGNVETACLHFMNEMDMKGIRPTKIVALSRGGLILGVILSHNLHVPMIPVQYSSKIGKGDDRNHVNELPNLIGQVVLVVDDIADSGHTLDEVVKHFSDTGSNVFSAAMYWKEGSVITPTMHWHELPTDAPFIHFPWEKNLR